MLSGKAVSGVIHYFNGTPMEYFLKKQETVETGTYAAEFLAARKCLEQVVELRNYLRYLGVPINNISYVFGDNKSMIDSAIFPSSKLHKRHHILSYHYVQSILAAGFVNLNHLSSENNATDIVFKHWGRNVYKLVKAMLHCPGETGIICFEKKRPKVLSAES